MTPKTVCLLAGFGFFALASFTQGILPMLEPQTVTKRVTRVVRTDLGQLKWIESKAADYTAKEQQGRKIYIREGCWYCHSQYVRPVTGETRRWGPITQSGEYAYDTPHLFSTRRIGPDLSRVGLKYSDEWHYAHFWDPRVIIPDSIMPRFKALFEAPKDTVAIVDGPDGLKTLEETDVTAALFDFDKAGDKAAHVQLTPNKDGLLFVPERGKYPVIWTPNKEFTGEAVTLAVVTDELQSLVAYLQKLGMNRGKWRDRFEPQNVDFGQGSHEKSEDWIEFGKVVYDRRCAGCHGVEGDGNGPAATFMYKDRPRDFTKAVFKFRSTSSDSLPTDGDIHRSIARGIRGTSMPSWHMLPEKDRLAVVQYIKYKLAVDKSDPEDPFVVFTEEEPEPPAHIARAPEPSQDIIVQGKEIWKKAKCWECHGETGKGDGEKAAGLKDDNKFSIVPADLTTGQFKSGSSVRDIYRSISTGLSGTPMPSYSDSFSEEERWALSYYVLSLSAFTDPLTTKPLAIAEADREALNDPELKANRSEEAYGLKKKKVAGDESITGGNAWARRRGMEVLGEAQAKGPEAPSTATR